MRNLNVSLSYMPWWTSSARNRVIIRSSVTRALTCKLPKLFSPTSLYSFCSIPSLTLHILVSDTHPPAGALRCQWSPLTPKLDITWHCLGSVTTQPKIRPVLMRSNCFFTGVLTQQSFTGVVTLPFRLLCHRHVSLFIFVSTCHLVMSCCP